MKNRQLNEVTLINAARDYAGQFLLPTVLSKNPPPRGRSDPTPIGGRQWVIRAFQNATFRDEFNFLYERFMAQIGHDAQKEFKAETKDIFTPRDNVVLEEMLAKKLAINPAGEHIKGQIGTSVVGERTLGVQTIEVETPESLKYRARKGLDKSHRKTYMKVVPKRERIYAGEKEEGGNGPLVKFTLDELGALNTNISAESTIAGLDAWRILLDEGTSSAVGEGRSTPQRADPDAAAAGSLGFSLKASDPMFLAAVDDTDGKCSTTADTITDDTSADATLTLLWMRWAATDTGSPLVPIDDHLDGECAAGGGADYNFNTLAIVAGAVVSMSALVVTQGQGASSS